ncbi:MAG: serine/threonine protein kinase [Chloroflexi bacterium]|nr:serine/threonine protein kinase [Chloroflexota bacterium]MBP8054465.1 serine/threonine protein kinase [Chloroflexota bacterium]
MSASQIGPYEIKNTLRHDRQYALFAAYDPRVREDVILKLWRKEFTPQEFAARIKREAEIINTMNHPAIVPIWGFGDLGGNTYIATLEMTGGTLAERLKRGPMPPAQAQTLFTRIAQAVEALHNRNVVHGHIQPQHILFDAKGEAYLAWTASQVNDVDYASPEQLNNQAPATQASDVFSLGILLLQLFTGKTLATITADELPAQYVPLLDRALYETPKDRFGSVREMLAAFKNPAKSATGTAPAPVVEAAVPDFAAWDFDTPDSPATPFADDDDPFAAWGATLTPPSPSNQPPAKITADPFAGFELSTTPKKAAAPDADAEMMALFSFDEGEDEPPPVEEKKPVAPLKPKQFTYDPGDAIDEPFPDWLEEKVGSPGAEPLLPTLDQFLTNTTATTEGVASLSNVEEMTKQSPSFALDPQMKRFLLIGGAVLVIALCLVLAVTLVPGLLDKPEEIVIVPTAIPLSTETPTPDPNAATITPTPTPSISINSPLPDTRVDLGTPLTLDITIMDPVGLRDASILINGQVIGTYTLNGETNYTITQDWIPDQGGTKRLSVVATSRTGTTFFSEIVVIRAIDRAMIDLNSPIWREVEANVSAIRGLEPLNPVEPDLVSRTEMIQRYRDEALASYTRADAEKDVLFYYAFDIVARDYDLYRRYTQYLGESIVGYYDPATEEFVVVNRGEQITPLGQLIYAHEFMHALQDQHFGLALLTETALTTDQNMAIRGLAEGEAELIQTLYQAGDFFSAEEEVDLFNESAIGSTQDTSGRNIPRLLVDAFYFPYQTGGEFVNFLYSQGGWPAIDQAWANPPQSSEHIIHPDRYLAGDVPQPVTLVSLTETLGAEWQLVRDETAGEFFIREHLLLQLGEVEAAAAATGWGGDHLTLYWNATTDEITLLFQAVWDTANDAAEFAAAYQTYNNNAGRTALGQQADGATCWQSHDVVCLYFQGAETLVVRAPSLELVTTFAAAQLNS